MTILQTASKVRSWVPKSYNGTQPASFHKGNGDGPGTGMKYLIYYNSFYTWCMWERTCKQAWEFQHQKIAAAFDKLEKAHQQLTSLAWWHGGQWQVPVTQMKPHLRATQATNTSAQLSNAPEPEWMSGWASSKLIEAFFRKEFKWFPIFGKAGRVKKAPYFTQPFSTTWSPDAWAVEGAVWFTGNKPCEGEVAGPLCWVTLHKAGWRSHTFPYIRSKTAPCDFFICFIHSQKVTNQLMNETNHPPFYYLFLSPSLGISADFCDFCTAVVSCCGNT